MRYLRIVGALAPAALVTGLLAISPAGVAAPVPAEAGKLPAPTKEQFETSVNNLKQIVIAVHFYHDTNGHLPNNVYSKDGKGLLSWRVLLLPYIEEMPLFKQFKFDEPW